MRGAHQAMGSNVSKKLCGTVRPTMSFVLSAVLLLTMIPIASAVSDSEDISYESAERYKTMDSDLLRETVEEAEGSYSSDSIIVVYEEDAYEESDSQVADALSADGSEVIADSVGNDGAAVTVEIPDSMSVADAVVVASEVPGVAYAQPDYIYTQMTTTVNDPMANTSNSNVQYNQWWLYSLDMFEAWDYARVEGTVTVAVIDSGTSIDHPDLAGTIDLEHAWDVVAGEPVTESTTSSSYAHGIHVDGIIGAEANNGIGIAGVTYNANVLPINVFYTSSQGQVVSTDSRLIQAYEYIFGLIDSGELDDIRVVNMSLGGYSDANPLLESVIIEARYDYNILTVSAGGNGDGSGNPMTDPCYPADYDSVISVVPIDSDDETPSWADYNEFKDIAAPGVGIWSTYLNNGYGELGGSSMASAMVSGVAALLFAAVPGITADRVEEVLLSTATDLGESGRDDHYGYGKINPTAALEKATEVVVSASDNATTIYRTQSLQLQVIASDNVDCGISWIWSSEDPSIATVSSDGTVIGVGAGRVSITVMAADDSDLQGSISICVKEIELPSALTAQSALGQGISISWEAAPLASRYIITRYDAGSETGLQIAEVDSPASDGSWFYLDTDAEAGTAYSYTVTPIATGNGVTAIGAESLAVKTIIYEEVTRISGDNRYETSKAAAILFEISASMRGEEIDVVIVASGESYPDALAASGLAGALGAPIVLATSTGLPKATLDVLTEISPSEVILVGGRSTLSGNLETAISQALPNVEIDRIAGSDRQETAEEIYRYQSDFWGSTAIVASGKTFADSLSISPYAFAETAPLFLTASDGTLDRSTMELLLDARSSGAIDRVVIVGGASSVSDTVESQLAEIGLSCERWAGADRYMTSAAIASETITEGVLSIDGVGFASGSVFADALVAGPLMGIEGSALLLIDDSDSELGAVGELVSQSAEQISSVLFFGGANTISESLAVSVAAAAGL